MIFFIFPLCTNLNSVAKTFLNQMVFTSSIKFFPFSKYLRFHLGVVLCHAKWASLIVETTMFDYISDSGKHKLLWNLGNISPARI